MSQKPEAIPAQPQAVEALFGSPDFTEVLDDWHQSNLEATLAEKQLADYFSSIFERTPSRSWEDIEDCVATIKEMGDETFEMSYEGDEAAMALHANRQGSREKLQDAKDKTVAFAQGFGVSEFAAYGLRTHLGNSPTDVLKEKVLEAERNFARIDTFIRNHPGKLLTIVADIGIYAGRIGENGISLSEKEAVVIPVAKDTKAYVIGLGARDDTVYEQSRLQVQACDIHSIFGSQNAQLYEDWSALLRISAIYNHFRNPIFIAGDVQDGEPDMSGVREEDMAYIYGVFDKIKQMGLLAMNDGTISTVDHSA